MLKANTVIQALNTFSRWNIFVLICCADIFRGVCVFWSFLEFTFHGRGFSASLVLKAALANLANQEGNISMSYQRKAQQSKIWLFSSYKIKKRVGLKQTRATIWFSFIREVVGLHYFCDQTKFRNAAVHHPMMKAKQAAVFCLFSAGLCLFFVCNLCKKITFAKKSV